MRKEPRNEFEANTTLAARQTGVKQGTHFLTPGRRPGARSAAPVSLVSRLCSLLSK